MHETKFKVQSSKPVLSEVEGFKVSDSQSIVLSLAVSPLRCFLFCPLSLSL